MKRIVAAAVALAAVCSPASAKAEDFSGGASFGGDDLGAHVRTQEPGSPGGQGGAGQRPFHYEVTYMPNAIGGCTDARVETVVRVWDDGSGRRDVVYAGCPRPDVGNRPLPPTVQEVRDAVGIPKPVIGSNPATKTLAGMATFFWYEGPTTRAVTVGLGGFTVAAQARAVRYEWSTGDGTTYTTTTPGSAEAPAVEHAYRHRGAKTVTVTVTWQGTFTFSGPGSVDGQGDLGAQRFTGSRTYTVEEVQPVGEL